MRPDIQHSRKLTDSIILARRPKTHPSSTEAIIFKGRVMPRSCAEYKIIFQQETFPCIQNSFHARHGPQILLLNTRLVYHRTFELS